MTKGSQISEGAPFPLIRTKKHQTIIADSEFICDIYSSTSNINLVEFRVAPWLSSFLINASQLIAPYEYYRIEHLEFYAQPVSTSMYSGSSQSSGYWGLAFIPDPLDTQYAQTKGDFMSLDGAVSAKSSFALHLKCDVSKIRHVMDRYLYTNRTTQDLGDIRLTDYGILSIATGQQGVGGFMLGALYCNYKISVRKLVPASQINPGYNLASYELAGFSSVPNNDYYPLGPVQYANVGSNVNLTFLSLDNCPYTNSIGQVVIFPDDLIGTFMLVITLLSSGNYNATWGSTNVFGNISLSGNNGPTGSPAYWQYASTNTATLILIMNITAPGQYSNTQNPFEANGITIDGAGMNQLVGLLSGNLWLNAINPTAF